MSGVSSRRVAEKSAYVRGEMEFLRSLPVDVDNGSNPAGVRAARYSLQTAVSALTDLAYHLCAKRYRYAPPNARDAFRRLAQAGVISDEMLAKISAMVGFRNLAAHGYEVFDDDRLRAILRTELGDMEALLRALETFAAAAGGEAGEP